MSVATDVAVSRRVARCAIVIATRDRGAQIVTVLDSILAGGSHDFELVVVDQSTSTETRTAMAAYSSDSRITYVHSDERGLSRARNLGIAATSAPYIVITDDDCITPPGWLDEITAPFDRNARVGLVFCTVRPVPTTEIGLTPSVTFPRTRVHRHPRTVWWEARHGLPLGAGMAVRRSTFEAVGGFDPMLGSGGRFSSCEDSDLSWRALLEGWATVHSARPEVLHDGFRDLEQVRELVKRDLYGIGGAVAKYLKAGHLGVLLFVVPFCIETGVVGPVRDVLGGRRPRGFRRPYVLMRGIVDGIKTPVDRRTMLYR